jgi:hypothetical protein
VKKELIAKILAPIGEVIADALASDDPARYVFVAKLAAHADKIRQMARDRVGDVSMNDLNDEAAEGFMQQNPDYVGALGYDIPLGNGRRLPRLLHNPGGEIGDMMRVLQDNIAQLMPERTTPRSRILRELSDLNLSRSMIAGREALEPGQQVQQLAIVDRQITQLLTELDKEPIHADDSHVVHPQLLRGHSIDVDGREHVRRDHDEPHVEREGSAHQAPAVRREEEVDPEGDQPHHERDIRVRGADRPGGEEARAAAQAGPITDHGREVRERGDGGAPGDLRTFNDVDRRYQGIFAAAGASGGRDGRGAGSGLPAAGLPASGDPGAGGAPDVPDGRSGR